MIQLNVRKQGEVHDSLMNDEEMQDVTVVAIQEPHARRIQGRLLTTPMVHHKWTKMVPPIWREGRWPIRSMLWVSREVEAEQVRIESPDLTAAIIRLHERRVLVVSVYIPGGDPQALQDTCNKLNEAITDVRRRAGTVVDVVLAGDFNQHDQLWGGEDVTMVRQGEADPIIDLMIEHALSSLLPRGTKTWQGGDYETTIDLVLASKELADTVTRCAIYATEHGSDHRTIETVFDSPVPAAQQQERLLLKNAPWKAIRDRISRALGASLPAGTTQQRTDRLMAAVLEAVHALTPRARPSPYAKRWWTQDLTQLRRVYTISCPASEFPDCEVKTSLIDDTAGECWEGSEQGIEKVCEPGVPDCVASSPQLFACESTWEPLEEVIASTPIGCDVIDCDALSEYDSVDTNLLQVSADSRQCPFQTSHILRGKGWRGCERCRETVKNLVVLSPDLEGVWSSETGM